MVGSTMSSLHVVSHVAEIRLALIWGGGAKKKRILYDVFVGLAQSNLITCMDMKEHIGYKYENKQSRFIVEYVRNIA